MCVQTGQVSTCTQYHFVCSHCVCWSLYYRFTYYFYRTPYFDSLPPPSPLCGLYWDVCEIVTLDVIIAWPRVYVPIWSNRATDPQCTWCNGRISDRWSDGVWFREPSGLLVGATKLLDLNREDVIWGEFDGESWNFSDDLVWFETLMVLVTSTYFCFRFTVPLPTFLFSYCCTFVCIATDRLPVLEISNL